MNRHAATPVEPVGGVHLLHPADVACAARGERLETLLGSCVAIVLTDPRRTVAAMCHVVNPGSPPRGAARPTGWGDAALAALEALLQRRGIGATYCEAFVFGGGNMFPGLAERHHVGLANAHWALDALAARGIALRHQDLGGACYRRVRWVVGSGAPEVCAQPVKRPEPAEFP